MGLFSKKKPDLSSQNMPQFPQFPRIPEDQPSYQPEFQQKFQPMPLPAKEIPAAPRIFDENAMRKDEADFLKDPIMPPMQHDESLPDIQTEGFSSMQPMDNSMEENFSHDDIPAPKNYDDRFARPMPAEEHGEMYSHSVEKPLFIKIDEYREALSNLDLLKRKIQERNAGIYYSDGS